jgi:ribose 5-phosphate isomerase A
MNLKQQAAHRAVSYVNSGMVIGLGSGSTTTYFIKMLGERLKGGKIRDIVGVPTSADTARLAQGLGIPLVSLAELDPHNPLPALDLAVDGADEIDPGLNLIKGLGRALLREKIVESHADQLIIIADDSKLVPHLGQGPLPVEVVPFEARAHVRWLQSLSSRAELWLEEGGKPVVTDNGNYLVRCWFQGGIPNPHSLAREMADHSGIVEHGLFLDMADLAIVAGPEGIQVKERK